MKAVSIKQPWASLIAHGIKDIENRTWRTNYRGRIYIHSSGKRQCESLIMCLTQEQQHATLGKGLDTFHSFPTSSIIGEVDIVDCVINHPSIWAEKTTGIYTNDGSWLAENRIYNWVLANPVLYDEPILNVKGKLSLWEFNR